MESNHHPAISDPIWFKTQTKEKLKVVPDPRLVDCYNTLQLKNDTLSTSDVLNVINQATLSKDSAESSIACAVFMMAHDTKKLEDSELSADMNMLSAIIGRTTMTQYLDALYRFSHWWHLSNVVNKAGAITCATAHAKTSRACAMYIAQAIADGATAFEPAEDGTTLTVPTELADSICSAVAKEGTPSRAVAVATTALARIAEKDQTPRLVSATHCVGLIVSLLDSTSGESATVAMVALAMAISSHANILPKLCDCRHIVDKALSVKMSDTDPIAVSARLSVLNAAADANIAALAKISEHLTVLDLLTMAESSKNQMVAEVAVKLVATMYRRIISLPIEKRYSLPPNGPVMEITLRLCLSDWATEQCKQSCADMMQKCLKDVICNAREREYDLVANNSWIGSPAQKAGQVLLSVLTPQGEDLAATVISQWIGAKWTSDNQAASIVAALATTSAKCANVLWEQLNMRNALSDLMRQYCGDATIGSSSQYYTNSLMILQMLSAIAGWGLMDDGAKWTASQIAMAVIEDPKVPEQDIIAAAMLLPRTSSGCYAALRSAVQAVKVQYDNNRTRGVVVVKEALACCIVRNLNGCPDQVATEQLAIVSNYLKWFVPFANIKPPFSKNFGAVLYSHVAARGLLSSADQWKDAFFSVEWAVLEECKHSTDCGPVAKSLCKILTIGAPIADELPVTAINKILRLKRLDPTDMRTVLSAIAMSHTTVKCRSQIFNAIDLLFNSKPWKDSLSTVDAFLLAVAAVRPDHVGSEIRRKYEPTIMEYYISIQEKENIIALKTICTVLAELSDSDQKRTTLTEIKNVKDMELWFLNYLVGADQPNTSDEQFTYGGGRQTISVIAMLAMKHPDNYVMLVSDPASPALQRMDNVVNVDKNALMDALYLLHIIGTNMPTYQRGADLAAKYNIMVCNEKKLGLLNKEDMSALELAANTATSAFSQEIIGKSAQLQIKRELEYETKVGDSFLPSQKRIRTRTLRIV